MSVKYHLFLPFLFFAAILLSACGPLDIPVVAPEGTLIPVDTPSPTPTPYDPMPMGSEGYPWWNDTVFYEIFVRSFYDSNEDGIGDFLGLVEQLDYLNDGDPNTTDDLGINGIWLMPIFPSPSYHGYDVTDYYQINPDYGSMEDFDLFLAEAHKRGIRVILDFVINHTSTQHPWFVDARTGEDSAFRDWYIWSTDKPDYRGPWGEIVWHPNYDGTYYYGVFWSGMPDLNFRNPDVTNEVYDIAKFWLDEKAVDGFRVDGARHLIEDGEVQENTEETHDWFKKFYAFYKEIDPQIMTVGEVWDSNFSAVKYVKDKEFDLVFDFEMAESILEGINRSDAAKIKNAFEFNTKLYPYLQKANFLTNHDMNRVMHVLQNDQSKAKLASVFLLTAPGVPFIYYGEEIGMLGAKPDEDIRKPMQWSGEPYGGFSTSIPWRSLNTSYQEVNVATQETEPDSILSTYKDLIQLRNRSVALRVGNYRSLNSNNSQIFTFMRWVEDEAILVITNPGNPISDVQIKLPEDLFSVGEYNFMDAFTGEEITSDSMIIDQETQTILIPNLGEKQYQIIAINKKEGIH